MKTEKEPTLKEKGILDKEVPRVYYKYEDIALALKKLKESIEYMNNEADKVFMRSELNYIMGDFEK